MQIAFENPRSGSQDRIVQLVSQLSRTCAVSERHGAITHGAPQPTCDDRSLAEEGANVTANGVRCCLSEEHYHRVSMCLHETEQGVGRDCLTLAGQKPRYRCEATLFSGSAVNSSRRWNQQVRDIRKPASYRSDRSIQVFRKRECRYRRRQRLQKCTSRSYVRDDPVCRLNGDADKLFVRKVDARCNGWPSHVAARNITRRRRSQSRVRRPFLDRNRRLRMQPTDDVEAEFGVGGGLEDVAEGFASQVVGPAMIAAFEFADVIGVEGRLTLVLGGQVGVDRVGQLP